MSLRICTMLAGASIRCATLLTDALAPSATSLTSSTVIAIRLGLLALEVAQTIVPPTQKRKQGDDSVLGASTLKMLVPFLVMFVGRPILFPSIVGRALVDWLCGDKK